MKYRALTVSREYGSGGAEIAAIIAHFLGWRLVDNVLIVEISKREQVSMKDAAALDEKIDPWIHRITRSIWGSGWDGISQVAPVHLFDAEEAAFIAKLIIEEAYNIGHCVIVGRGSQCILQGKEDVFHAFIYAGWENRVRRIIRRLGSETNVEERIRLTDLERSEYVRLHYKRNRLDPYLYDIMIDSKDQPDEIAQLIISAMRMVPVNEYAS
jgi:cytidylate kinase